MSENRRDISRQALLRKAGLLGLAAAGVGAVAPTPAAANDSVPWAQSYPFHGTHQGGSVTSAQDYIHLGAPLGANAEFAPLNLKGANQQGVPLLPSISHVRPAHQGPERILRRGYSFSDGLDPITGGLEAGLLFICFQRDPRNRFIPLQTRLATLDALNEYIVHTGSAIFACPPGALVGGYVGEGLLKL